MKLNEKGYMLISVIFLTLIVSFVATMTLQAMMRVKNGDAALRLHAMNLANEQFALIESRAAQGLSIDSNFLGDDDDLVSYGLFHKNAEKIPTEFKVMTTSSGSGNLRKVTVAVTWKDNQMEFEKVVYFNSP